MIDWVWYDEGGLLCCGLDEGYLGAPNTDPIRFALMWANDAGVGIHPTKLGQGAAGAPLLSAGTLTPKTFDRICDLVIEVSRCMH